MQKFLSQRRHRPARSLLLCLLALLPLSGCETVPSGVREARLTMAQQIQAEPSGDYFIGRRYARPPYHFWGYVRRPRQPWSSAVLVVFNENKKLAPDREQMQLGFDDNYEYRLQGYFSGDKVYEVASNRVLPEFVLTGDQLLSTHPAPIFPSRINGQKVSPLLIEKPE
ncbi:MAG TPA: hypothetical protein VGI85_01150 [Chthoniobacterales bacterium]